MSIDPTIQHPTREQFQGEITAIIESLPDSCQTCPDLQVCIDGVRSLLTNPSAHNRATARFWAVSANELVDNCPGNGPEVVTKRRPPIIGKHVEIELCRSDKARP